MQSLKILIAFLVIGLSVQAQNMNNSMAQNRLSAFNVAHAGLDGNQINYSALLNSRYGSNSSLLFETQFGKSNFSFSGQIENSANFFYAAQRKQLGLSYRIDLQNGKKLNFGVGYGTGSSSYLSSSSDLNYKSRHYQTTRLGAIYSGDRFKVGAEFAMNFGKYGAPNFNALNLLYQQVIVDRERFKLTTNLVVSNFTSSLEANMLFNNKVKLVTGVDSNRGIYLGAGYKFTNKFEINLSSGIQPSYSINNSVPVMQIGFKLAL
ncbi:hypothetical protein SAMN05216474_2446 [Lishizhenia tianjinensis]|uniref:Type IX secretion system membrane protein, PorP/SprF family n=1 Tax=Lishizhenia tianjinensis TaxID=477690 RepID=A0A1I7B0S7_9FLAO|nr:hypothetical protein [Lishizhenia tianjinensis]SFT80796.1 hypothetical protein SAMN05216474_2446 [Lishizhenia tianjinensis]